MTTPTDDEIVAHMSLDPASSGAQIARQALRLAREGLPVPVKDEAVDLHNALGPCIGGYERIATIRQFLANRDAERDAEVAALIKAAKRLKARWPTYSDLYGLTAALAKLERKP
jgi:hypothetical protein